MSDRGATLAVVGVSFHSATLEHREKLAYAKHEIGEGLRELQGLTGAAEAVLLSTCNRTELYLVEREVGQGAETVWAAWSARLGVDASALGYLRRGGEAAGHLYRVTAGLDSMVLGEAQIQGQVREAWDVSRAHAGPVLHRLFQSALQIAGRVRSETGLGRGAASVSSAAVRLATQIFGSLTGRRAMVLGAGEMADLALECLAAEGVRTSVVANRTYERAEALAARHGARAMHYDEAWTTLADVDVLLCSTASPIPIVTLERMREVAAARGDRPLCVLDIALPRDVDPRVRELQNVYLYDLDDLQDVVRASLARRREELPAAERLVQAEVARFLEWMAGLSAVPTLTAFRGRMEAVRAREVEQALRKLGALTPAQRAAVEQLSRGLMNKFMHEPTVQLRAAAADGGVDLVEAVRRLFALDDDEARAAAAARRDDAPSAMTSGSTTHSGDE
ncbi:MAG TPA: glutamyl-tRNA reductase [Gemmatimonadaceae bacterium]|nr:glutamyl-tRNA reductase [Gemmatimonadaceae bacterium]